MTNQAKKKIVISGAGIAGVTLAYYLSQHGYDVEIIEKMKAFQSRHGYLLDFWGPGYEIAENMGIIESLKQKDCNIEELIYINEAGRRSSSLDVTKVKQLLNNRVFTLLRGDLEHALLEKLPDSVKIRSGTEISSLTNHTDHVSLTLTDGEQLTADFVFGADGIHSKVRQLLWGEESRFSRYLGYHLGAFIHSNNINLDPAVYTYSTPKKQVSVFPFSDDQVASFFIYKAASPAVENPKESLTQQFKQAGWVIPKVLHNLSHANEFLLDTLTQIEVPCWHKGRVALLGDACQCLTLMAGQGASMAMAGAYTIAIMLQRYPDDYTRAFEAYHQQLKTAIEDKQNEARKFIRSFVPDTRFGIFCRNLVTKWASLPGLSKLFFKGLLKETFVMPTENLE